ncbi:hypothetical protein BU25DRAFT_452580 [Macroventuria anomochaeta]|uniref:Uncharacterized protein n=1 Tax=Macroventuria anomochaeta TaxID=301207 RepID=A0ACB6RJH9_9PLEO|nr:uncharacterized protein BU25DRAFT_452580 [Macroventuria anomochaeta]KAF2621565.1 hypothetical protein BU25DRAFT_452580 [Macroventuria anomochaeta]
MRTVHAPRQNPIADFIIASAADGTTVSVYRNETPIVYECVLSWCVKTVQSSYEEGIYKEDITGIQMNTTAGPLPWFTRDITTPYQNGTEMIYNDDISIITKAARLLACQTVFPSFLATKDNSTDLILRYKIWLDSPAYNRKLDINPWLAPNISAYLSRMATAITNQIRTVGSGNENVRRTAYSQEVFIRVQWAWFDSCSASYTQSGLLDRDYPEDIQEYRRKRNVEDISRVDTHI